jgi:hypothetical protein
MSKAKFNNLRPESYSEQNGCHNCSRSFYMYEYDDGPQYYCAFKAGPRPKCGSVCMNEGFNSLTRRTSDKQYSKNMRRWDKWSDGRKVEAWGICGQYKEDKG